MAETPGGGHGGRHRRSRESPRATTPLLPTLARAPGPGGHPAPSGRSRGLGCGQAPGAGTAATRDFTPPSWEPAARCSQQCTSCFKDSNCVCWQRGRGAAADGASKGQRLAHAAIQPAIARRGPAATGSLGSLAPARLPLLGLPLPAAGPAPAAGRTSLGGLHAQAPWGRQQALGFRLPPASPPYPASASQEKNHLREGIKTRALPRERRLRVCKSGKLAATSQQIHA